MAWVKRPRYRILKSKEHFFIDAQRRKNLIHLQSILLFKDSSEATPHSIESASPFRKAPGYPGRPFSFFFSCYRPLLPRVLVKLISPPVCQACEKAISLLFSTLIYHLCGILSIQNFSKKTGFMRP